MKRLIEKTENCLAGHLLGKEVDIEFLSVSDLLAIHDQVVSTFGGSNGVRDRSLLSSAVHRPMQAASYCELDALSAAAMLGEAIIKNHAFVDGNKRTGFFGMLIMLDRNGYDFDAEAVDIVYAIKGLASSQLSEEQFRQWVARCAVRREDQDTATSRPKP